jgi:ClpP class serine protease
MRGDFLIAQAKSEVFFLDPRVLAQLTDFANNEFELQAVNNTANNSVTMQMVKGENDNSIAVLNIDGAMYKKDMSGFCMSIASYQKIQTMLNEVEIMYQAGEVQKLILRVSTPGGTVAGLNALEVAISRLSVPVITFAEDQLCSAGVYAFMGPKKVYAAPMTEIGSIGVVVELYEDKDKKIRTRTSSRAKNKRPDLKTEEGMAVLQTNLDEYEQRFYDVVVKNTGFTEEQIEKEFNSGSTIMSEKALEIGFIDGVMMFEDLLEQELATMPSDNEKIVNSKQGANMENFMSLDMTENNFNTLKVMVATRNETIKALEEKNANLTTSLDEATAALDTKDTEMSTKLSEAKTEATQAAVTRLQEAGASNVTSAQTMIAMVQASTDEEASKLAIESNKEEATQQNETKAQGSMWDNFLPKGDK